MGAAEVWLLAKGDLWVAYVQKNFSWKMDNLRFVAMIGMSGLYAGYI